MRVGLIDNTPSFPFTPRLLIRHGFDRPPPVIYPVLGTHNNPELGGSGSQQNRPCPSILAMFRHSPGGHVETGSMVVTYSDQLTDAPPRGVVLQCSGLLSAATSPIPFRSQRL